MFCQEKQPFINKFPKKYVFLTTFLIKIVLTKQIPGDIITFVDAGLCKGSTTDSDSVCLGSNPSPATRKNDKFRLVVFLMKFAFCK